MKKSTQALVAAAVRKELKVAFPKTTFKVAAKKFFADSPCIFISWVDGPTTDAVNKITYKYGYKRPDGMCDIYSGGDVLRVKSVMLQRGMSKQTATALKIEISKEYGVDMDDIDAAISVFNAHPDSVIYRKFSSIAY